MINNHNDGLSEMQNEYMPLAHWLQQILATSPQDAKAELASATGSRVLSGDEYHFEFYSQLPDFALALLNNITQEDLIRFGPLVFHIIACPACHAAYLEIYDSMRAAIGIDEAQAPASQSQPPIATIYKPVLVFMCQLLITQAAEVLREARRKH